MQEEQAPYIHQHPGDLITAENWNDLQRLVRQDIEEKTQEAIEGIEHVPAADDASKLEGRTASELTDEIIERVIDEVRRRRGYLKLFKILPLGEEVVVEHGFNACPLVDLYQLDYFRVVCSEDMEVRPAWTTFYLSHTDESKLRYPKGEFDDDGYPRGMIEIVPKNSTPQRVALMDMLERYKVPYTEDSSLGDLETELWRALFADPNDEFDDDQYCHSPWFDKCCREEKIVSKLKSDGDWNELWVHFHPRKTVNYPGLDLNPFYDQDGNLITNDDGGADVGPSQIFGLEEGPVELPLATPAPNQVQVRQLGWNKIGLKLLKPPIYSPELLRNPGDGPPPWRLPEEFLEELKVMVLLKC